MFTMSSQQSKSSVDGLPRQFVASLRVLFDILDENKTGYVRLQDIETRWQDGAVTGLPNGVVEALQKVTPTDGRLTFERFVAGLKIALLRSKRPVGSHVRIPSDISEFSQKSDKSSTSDPENSGQNREVPHRGTYVQPPRSGVEPRSNHANSHFLSHGQPHNIGQKTHRPTTATVRPNNAIAQQRTTSMPQLGERKENVTPSPPPVPQRSDAKKAWQAKPQMSHAHQSHGALPREDSRNGIANVLKSWHKGKMLTENGHPNRKDGSAHRSSHFPDNRDLGDGRPGNFENIGGNEHADFGHNEEPVGPAANRRAVRRKEPRRHTLANGIDYNMIKRMKQLEQEKDVLIQGLEVVEQARDWYHKQIMAVQDKQKYISKAPTHNDYSVDSYQERMNFQTARIFEVNQQLKALMDSSEKGFPLHMNLAVRQQAVPPQLQERREESEFENTKIAMTKAQNRLLTQEVSQKSERIAQLEREKAALIREMFEARSKNRNTNYDDTTFM